MHQLRWRKPPPDRRRRWLALGIVLVLHGLFGLLTWHEMQSQQRSSPAGMRRGALQVRLIARPPRAAAAVALPPTPALPAPAVPPPVARPRPAPEPPAPQAMTVTLPPPAPAPVPAAPLYDASGQPRLPSASSASEPPAASYVQRTPQGDARLMQHDSVVHYQPTRFDKDWQKGGGSSVDDALKRAVDSSTVTHTFHIAPGVRLHCAISFAALAGGCGGDPPPAPPSKDGDVRLNMAPASALAPGTATSTPPGMDECIAIYRADKPLPQGCPVDTPTRAVDAELRERAARQGG
ncbi:hypothetical protein EZM97_30195 [Dyella soli]|uniref:Uncharacterized protein n=1 Tax=Dyella soli TaxID=522319 RepID=A0A4R0YJL5_9GAMM|nr:hypothetical protein EZM97_30195 [Dyella soli]